MGWGGGIPHKPIYLSKYLLKSPAKFENPAGYL